MSQSQTNFRNSPSTLNKYNTLSNLTLTKKGDGPAFKFTTNEIPTMSKTTNLDRLMLRPPHKVDRLKFDKTKVECLVEKENNPLTM